MRQPVRSRKRWLPTAIVVLILSGLLAFYFYGQHTHNGAAVADGLSEQTSRTLLVVDADTHSSIEHAGSSPLAAQPFRHEVRIGDPLFEPKTQEEADWLNRQSFPSHEEMVQAAEGNTDPQLLDIHRGVNPTAIINAERIAIGQPEMRDRAIDYLIQAASQGSIYALQALGRVYSSPDIGNPIRSEAYYRAAEMRGDWNSGLRIKAPLNNEQSYVAGLLAHQALSQIDSERARRNLGPLRPDPRPGLDSLLRNFADSEYRF